MNARQREILTLRAKGLPVKAVARALGINEKTVKNNTTAAFAELGALNIVDAMNLLGWVRDDEDADAEARFLRPINPDPLTTFAKANKVKP